MKKLLATISLLMLPIACFAQVITPTPQSVNGGSTVCFASTDTSGTPKRCASWSLSSYPTVTMQITGTFSGTLNFEATSDGLTWFAVSARNLSTGTGATTTTSTGQYALSNTGILAFRVRGTGWGSGGANITLTRGTATGAP